MDPVASKHSSCRRIMITLGIIFGVATFLIPNFAQAADDPADTSALAPPSLLGGVPPAEGAAPAIEGTEVQPTAFEQSTAVETPAVDAANHADLSIDNLVLPSALEAQQDAALDQAFAALPAASPDGTAPNAEAIVAQRLAAIQDSAQEAATLGYGASENLLGTPEEMGHAGRSHEEAGCLTMFQGSVGVGFEALTQGLPEGSLPPETIARFEAMHERFEQMVANFQGMIFGGPREGAGNLPGAEGLAGPGGAPLPGAMAPIGGPEGFVMPAVGGFQFQDLGAMFGAAALGVDPAQFAQSMSQMIEARAEAFVNANIPNPGNFATPGEFLAQLGGPDVPAGQVWMPDGQGGFGLVQSDTLSQPFGGDFHFGDVMLQDPAFNTAVLAITQDIAHQITENITQNFTTRILSTLPPEALNVINALNQDFTAADLATLGGGPISRAFSAEISDHYKGVDYPGQEHIHVTYTLTGAGGDGLVSFQHVDANVTAIHSADHDPSKNVDLAQETGEEHIPGIVA